MNTLDLNQQDIADLNRYKKLFKDTGDRFWAKAIEWFENGKERELDWQYRRKFTKAKTIIQSLERKLQYHSAIRKHMGDTISENTISRILNDSFNGVSEHLLDLVIQWQLNKLNEIKKNLKES